jgi:ElaB/YqjD/DUF883 family membrane-anchored ribosome-binding protein
MQADIRNSSERVAGDLHTLLSDAEQLIHAVTGASGEAMEAARARLQERVVALKRAIGDRRDAALASARTSAGLVDGYVHANPWAMMGAALAAGVVIGLLARRGVESGASGLH